MSPLGHIVDMVRLDLEFLEDSIKTRSSQRFGRLFCVWMPGGSESVSTCDTTRYKTTRKQSCSAAGPYKIYIIQCDFLEMVIGNMSSKRKLFHDKPTATLDNNFVTDAVLDWYGNGGLGIIDKNARKRIPKDIELFYLHKEKTNETMKHTKA